MLPVDDGIVELSGISACVGGLRSVIAGEFLVALRGTLGSSTWVACSG